MGPHGQKFEGQPSCATAPRTGSTQEDQLNFYTDSSSQNQSEGIHAANLLTRRMVWVRTPRMEAYTCFACAWAFRPSGPPLGDSLDEMMRNYEIQRDQEFVAHVCAHNRRPANVRNDSKFPTHRTLQHAASTEAVGLSAKA